VNRRFGTILLFRIFSILTLLLVIPAAVYQHSPESLVMIGFGAAVVLVAFGFGFGQSVERRAQGSEAKQWLDTLVVAALAGSAAGLALVSHNSREQKLWFAIAVLALLLESFYRLSAERISSGEAERREPPEG